MAANWGKTDFKDLIKLRDNIEDFIKNEDILVTVAEELAELLVSKVIPRTPVDTGDLRKSWIYGRPDQASAYVSEDTHEIDYDVDVAVNGNYYEIWVVNPIEYAKYVELGHRTRNHKSWVKGRHMLRISINEVKNESNRVVKKHVLKALKEVFM